jgi:salicylate synthase
VGADPVAQVGALASCGRFGTHVAYERDGHWWFAGGAAGSVELRPDRIIVRWDDDEQITPLTSRPGVAIHAALDALPRSSWRAYGWAAFELAYLSIAPHLLEGDEPLLHLVVPRTEIEITGERAVITGMDDADVAAAAAVLAGPLDDGHRHQAATVDLTDDSGRYRAMVADAVERIGRGDLEKVILSRRIPVPAGADFAATYVAGRRGNTPARSFLLDVGGWRAAGFSPEIVAEVAPDGLVRTEPLAGTRALGRGHRADVAAYAELCSDPKEVHEHAISVRLACEELRSVCDPDSVVVTEFMARKERGSVQHLGSTVVGHLADGRTAWDAFERLFPSVTASGIPKAAAFEQITRLETHRRGLYAGAVLRVDSSGALDAALVLRSLLSRDGNAWLRAGAGVVADSRPERELEETCEKLASVAPFIRVAGTR